MRILLVLVAIIALIYVGLCAALLISQRSLIYFPQARALDDPQATMHLTVADADLVLTVRKSDGEEALLYFGGNAEDVSLNLPTFAQAFPRHALYLMHYRGYGGSSGEPSEGALQGDALALFDRVHGEHGDISVVGRSLGSGIAIRLASQRPATQLILVTPFDSMREIAAAHFPYFPVRWLLRDGFESTGCAPAILAPTLLLAAQNDEIVPAAGTSRLLAAFPPKVATLEVVQGASHNDISSRPRYLEAMRSALGY